MTKMNGQYFGSVYQEIGLMPSALKIVLLITVSYTHLTLPTN